MRGAHPGWWSIVLIGSVVSAALPACRCAGPRSHDGGGAAAASEKAPVVARADASTPFLEAGEATLSLFEPKGSACEWLQVDPVMERRRLVATFEGDCHGARVSWSPDGAQALVWFDPETLHVERADTEASQAEAPRADAEDRLFRVELSSGQVRPLPFPEVPGSVDEVGLTAGGDVLALVQESLPSSVRQAGRTHVDGEELTWHTESEGLRALAHAYRLDEERGWTRFESKPTSEGWDPSLGVGALEAAKALGPRSAQALSARLDGEEVNDDSIRERLESFVPRGQRNEGGGWVKGHAPDAGTFYAWRLGAEAPYTTGQLVLERDGGFGPAPELGFDAGTLVAVRTRGPYLLVAHNGTGTKPRLYDLREGRRLFASDTARATVFWPAFR